MCNNIIYYVWLTSDRLAASLGWMILLNKSLKSFSSGSGWNKQIDLLHTEDRARMHKKDAQNLSTQFLTASFLTSSHKGRSKFSVLNETENLKARLNKMLYFSKKFRKTADVHNNSCYAGKAHMMTGF